MRNKSTINSSINNTSIDFQSEEEGINQRILQMIIGLIILFILSSCYLFFSSRRKRISANQTTIPFAKSPIPWVGHGLQYFNGPFRLIRKLNKIYGESFYITFFGRPWLILLNKADLNDVFKQPEKKVSMLKATLSLIGFALPQDAKYTKKNQEQNSVPFIIHSIRKDKMLKWFPMIRQSLSKDVFDKMTKKEGTFDLFNWCQDLISAITIRILLGNDAVENNELLETFTKLFYEADPEQGFRNGPHMAITSLLQYHVLGEKLIFIQIRKLIYPLIDKEINRVLDGGKEQDDCSVMSSYVLMWYKKLKYDDKSLRESKRRIFNDLFKFFFAAFSNSFAGAAWTLYHTLKNTNGVGDEIRKELLEIENSFTTKGGVGGEGWKGLESCQFMEWTVLEISRLYTPGNLFREVITPWKMPSTDEIIPSGTFINIPLCVMLRDPNYFKDPLTFDPLRYSPGREEHKTAGTLFSSFGSGTHPCVGKRFAMFEIAIFVFETLKHFDLEIIDEGQPDTFTLDVNNVPNHPRLDPTQAGFLWRPVDPIIVKYRRK